MIDWIILYSDSSTFSSEDGAWENAPGRDVQIILFQHPRRGWTMRHGGNTRKGDFFRLDGDEVVGMDLTGVIDHAVHEMGVIKEGRMLSQDHWNQVLNQATVMLKGLQA
jgi:hypothetical protein